MRSSSRTGLVVSLIFLFLLQAFLPFWFDGFKVSAPKWFLMQGFLFVVVVFLVGRVFTSLLRAGKPGDQTTGKDPLSDINIVNPDILVGAVIHELRTPLNKLSLILSNTENFDRKEQLSFVVDDLVSTVEHIESVFRGDNLNSSWVPTAELFKQVQDHLGSEEGVEFHLGVDWIYLDPGKMEITLTNLIENALDAYGGNSGNVTVGASSVGPEWCLTIEDTAGGMDPETARVISSQGSAKESESGGMGLGLLIARKIVENHNGRMVVESDPGRGTEITITLPKPSTD